MCSLPDSNNIFEHNGFNRLDKKDKVFKAMKKFLKELKNNREYISFSVRATLKAEVAGSYLNWFWWVLEPLLYMIIYATVFGMIFESSEKYYPVFIFIGNTFWALFSRTMVSSVSLIKQNETIISKVYLPKYILLIIDMGVNCFKFSLNVILIGIMMVIFKIPLSINILYIIPILIDLFVVSFGIGTFLMHYGVYIEDLTYVVSILMNMLMFFSGVFYSVEERLDYPIGIIIGKVNPIAFILTAARQALIYCQVPDITLLLIWLGIGLLLSILGVRKLYKNENNYAKVI